MGELQISLGGGGGADLDVITAEAGNVLSGKVIVDKDGNPLTGTMPNQGAKTASLNCGGSYTIPAGYHNGSGKVAANSLASQTDATATAALILSGYTAWAKGSKITGTMANQGAKTASLNCGGSYTIPPGYHNGSGKVTANSLASQTSANATAGNILSGKTAYVNGTKITGTIASLSGGTYTPSTSSQTIYCSGKYMTGNITFNSIPSGYVNVNGSADLFNNGSFGTIAGGARAVEPLPTTSNKNYCFQYQGIVNNRLRWTRISDVHTTIDSQQSIIFKKKIPFQYYSWIEIEGYYSFANARYRPTFFFGNSTSFVTVGTGFNSKNITYKISYGESNGLCGYLYDGAYHWNTTPYDCIGNTGELNRDRALVHIKISNITESCYFGISFSYAYGLPTGSSVGTVCDISRITLLK